MDEEIHATIVFPKFFNMASSVCLPPLIKGIPARVINTPYVEIFAIATAQEGGWGCQNSSSHQITRFIQRSCIQGHKKNCLFGVWELQSKNPVSRVVQ